MKKPGKKVKILGASAVKARLRRMAYEIYEKNFTESEVVLVGIDVRGGFMAGRLASILEEISPLKVTLVRAKKSDGGIAFPEEAVAGISGRAVVVVDDVLYSGHTMFRAVAAVMAHDPATVQTAVLIDRGHRSVPVTHDYVGMMLATSLKQYVSVEVEADEGKAVAFIF